MNPENRWGQLVAGLSVLAVGLIFWLDHLHKIEGRDYLQWWPLVLIALGIAQLIERGWAGAVILIVLGIVFLPNLPFLHIRPSQILEFWPLLITVGGVTLVMQALRPSVRDPNATMFRAIAVMGGNGRTIDVPAGGMVAGDAIAVMGGCDITFKSGIREAVVDVLAFWGGIEIKVPRGWKVETRMAAVLGALVNKASPTTNADAPRLILRGSVIMGAVEVKEL